MPEKRRIRLQTKLQRTGTQTTLRDHFQRTNSNVSATEKPPDMLLEQMDPVVSSPEGTDSHAPPAEPSKPPKPIRLFPIFTKVSSARQGLQDTDINVDEKEVIDITDTSDVDLSNEPPMPSSRQPSTRQPSPCSELSHAVSYSPPTLLSDRGCQSNTSLPHAATRQDTHVHKTSKVRVSIKRNSASGDVVPLPSACSQHVRGPQHPYACAQVPSKRCVLPSVSLPGQATLEFLARCKQADDVPPIFSSFKHQSLSPEQCEERLRSVNRKYVTSHPAFAQICVDQETNPSYHNEAWTRRFRPRRANQVLGNEQHATYLRDWLSALGLLRVCSRDTPTPNGVTVDRKKKKSISNQVEQRGVKRPRVIRTVTKKRGKRRRTDSDDELDDFVILSDEDEEQPEEPPEDSEDELAFCQRTFTRIHRYDEISADNACPVASNTPAAEIDSTTNPSQGSIETNFDELTNTLLITGPPGCGKTAAVYACAEELGWEVFEVYPGIGKRSGANLEHLVGDVGRNHIVHRIQRRGPVETTISEVKERVGLRGYLGTRKTGKLAGSKKPSQEAGTQGQPISVEGNSPVHEAEPPLPEEERASPNKKDISEKGRAGSEGSRPIVGQSLVLLEEVDILYKEDAGFWPAVVEFIQSCQRPVVLTCNDPGLVPVGDLPLQRVLVFEPCPSQVAAGYLQCLALSEGWFVPHEDLMAGYERTHTIDGLDMPGGPLYPRTGPLPLPDLRRCITELQMLCAGARHGSTSEMHQGDEAEGHVRRSARAISGASRVTTTAWRAERELWRQMKHAEAMSHVDGELMRTGMCMREMTGTGMGTGTGTGDESDEVGYVALRGEGLVYYGGDELIAEEAIRHARGGHEEDTDPMEASINAAGWEEARGFRARVDYQSRMVYALQPILGPGAPLVPQQSVFLDYIPWVRLMVATDEEEERRAWAAARGGAGGRATRNSVRAGHVRTVALGDGERAALMGGVLEGSGLPC